MSGEQTHHIATPAGPLAITVLEPRNRDSADAQYLVFLHPTNLDSRCWWPVAERMDEHWCVLIDSRGHGASHRRGPFVIANYATDVWHVISERVPGRAHLVGGSLGGSIACAVAGGLPQSVASICVIGGALEPAEREVIEEIDALFRSSTPLREIFDTVLSREIELGFPPEFAARVLAQIDVEHRPRDLIHEITVNAFSEDGRRYARDVRCPVTVLNGEHDESCPPPAGERMAALLRGRFELLPRLGHLAMVQAPELIADHLRHFVNTAGAASMNQALS